MAAGTLGGAPVPDPTALEGDDEVEETKVECEQPVVRPKQLARRNEERSGESQEAQGTGATQSSSGHWWHSSTLIGTVGPRLSTTSPAGAPFQGWRERQWAEDEEEWNYSTGPGMTTMDVLRERFGEASFRDAPSWQPWAPGLDPSINWQGRVGAAPGSENRFRLASPKLRAEQALGRARVAEYRAPEASASSLG